MKRVFALLLAVACVSCGGTKLPTAPAPVTGTVTYSVTGTILHVDLAYTGPNGATAQQRNASVPWTYSFTAKGGDALSVSAQILGSSGRVTVTILKDGVEYQTATNSGGYATATASGTF